jgi:lambda family phage tail tape measure protein
MATIDTYAIRIDTQQANAAINSLKGVLGGLAAAFSIRTIAGFGDSITRLQNRLATISPAAGDVEKQFKAIAAIAIAARTPLEQTGDLYFRIARAANDLGISQKEAASITESVAKAISASGMSAQEAAGPLLQLGQALQSGRFQGDELRSILEGMPVVATALADELGVTVGELRKLGSEGKLTGDVFVRAMARAKQSIDDAFGRTSPTISAAFQSLKTSSALAFAEFEKNSGVGRSTAASIELIGYAMFRLSKNIDAIMGPLSTFIKVVGSILAFTVVGKVLGGIGLAVRGLVTWFGKLGASLSLAKDFLLNFTKVLGAVGGGFTGIGAVILGILKPLGMLIQKFGGLAAGVATFIGLDKFFDWFKQLGESNSDAQNDLKAYREELKKFQDDLNDTQGPGNALIAQQRELARAIEEVEISLQRSARAYYDQVKAVEDELALQLQLTGQTRQQKSEAEALKRAETAYLQERRRIQDAISDAERSQKAEEKAGITLLQKQLSDLDKSYQKHGANIKKLMTEQYTASRTFSAGWKEAFNEYVDNATNAADGARRAFQTFTQATEDLLFNFFKTGKFGFKQFLQTIIDELLRSQIRQLIAKTFTMPTMGAGAGGGGRGGLLGGSIIPGFLASGGPANANKPYIVGERGPELFVPRSTGTVVPNDQLGMGGSSVTYNINAVDAMSFKQMIAQDPSFLYAVSEQGRRRLPGGR